MSERINDLSLLLTETKATKEATHNQYLDLKDVDYRHDPETGFHILQDRVSGEVFVLQNKTALRQLCRMVKVPYAFVVKNPNFLNDGIMGFWLDRALSGDDTGSRKSKLSSTKILRYYTSGGLKHVRSIMDEDIVPVDNFDLLHNVLSAFSDGDVELDFASGTGMDDESFHSRFYTKDAFDPGDGLECRLGFHLRSSELAQGNIILDALVYRQVCSNGAIITYGNTSYFSSKFRDVMLEDMQGILSNCVQRMQMDLGEMLKVIRTSVAHQISNDAVRDLFGNLKNRRGLNRNFIESVEGHALELNISNFWQVTNTITRAAQELPDNNRLKYESLAGNLLNLNLPKLV